MLDFILGLYLAALGIRGWVRGFVKEAVDLAGLFFGVIIGFRLSVPVGDFLADRFTITPEWARIGAGIVVFILVGLGFSVFASVIGRFMRLPGLNMSNRLLGVGLAMAWGVFLILILVAVVEVVPVPGGVEDAIDDSTVISTLAGEDSYPGGLVRTLAGDDILGSLLALRSIASPQRIILDADDVYEIPPSAPEDLSESKDKAAESLRLLNETRVGAGANPLAPSVGLSEVALAHAMDMYVNGYVSHRSPTTGGVADRIAAAGIRLTTVGENLALASSTRAVHAGFLESNSHREVMLAPGWDRVGVAAVEGPYGLMVVQVYGG